MRLPSIAALGLVGVLLPADLCGQEAAAPQSQPRKATRAVRIVGDGPDLDGRLDDAAWRDARFFSDFLQKDPVEGAPPTEATDVAFLYDAKAIWIGARMHSRDPGAIRRLVSRRDQPGNTERIIVTFDTYCDRRTAYSFALSVSGVRSDYYHPGDDEYWRDHSYNPVWEGRTAVDSAGWTAEIRIPFSQLRFNDRNEQVWGVNLNRWVPARNEDVFWVYVPKNTRGWSSWFGDLVGIEGIEPPRRLELLPYVAGDARFSSGVAAADPFHDPTEVDGRAGADLKMGLGPNLTLDGTVNPDFGQVDADPAEINLTQFETFFDERRPFFIEGSQLLSGNGPGYFYSRRIGAPPPGPASGDYVARPPSSTILAAAKVTGRLSSGLSLGVLSALTDREYADTYDAASGTQDRTLIAPRTGWGVVRLQQEFGAEKSTVGGMLTGVSRDLESGDALADRLVRHALSGGADAVLRFARGQYQVNAHAGGSWVEGTRAALERVQRSSARYYQRPDAGHVELDPARTSLGGWAAGVNAERLGGARWLWSSGLSAESPGFELNDAGQLQSADDIDGFAQLRYRETRPGRTFRGYDLRLTTAHAFNFGGVRRASSLALDTDWTWPNFMHTYLGTGYEFDGLLDDHTRGGPLFLRAPVWSVNAGLESNFAATTRWEVYSGYYDNEIGAWDMYVEAEAAGRIGDRWELTVAPSYARGKAARQYVAERPGGPPATFGTRYLFSNLDHSTLRLQLRLAYALTPNLTLEGYAEPFASTGRYHGFGELRAARTNDLLVYGTEGTTIERDADDTLTITDGPDTLVVTTADYRGDFEGLSYRSNLVLRWEWSPGSSLFFIWQQDRSENLQSSTLVRPGDLWDAFTAPGDQFLAVKVSYWIPVR